MVVGLADVGGTDWVVRDGSGVDVSVVDVKGVEVVKVSVGTSDVVRAVVGVSVVSGAVVDVVEGAGVELKNTSAPQHVMIDVETHVVAPPPPVPSCATCTGQLLDPDENVPFLNQYH